MNETQSSQSSNQDLSDMEANQIKLTDTVVKTSQFNKKRLLALVAFIFFTLVTAFSAIWLLLWGVAGRTTPPYEHTPTETEIYISMFLPAGVNVNFSGIGFYISLFLTITVPFLAAILALISFVVFIKSFFSTPVPSQTVNRDSLK